MAKVIYNNIIPFNGFQAITILPFVFARKSYKPLKDHVINHEGIHLRQQMEVLVVAAAVIASLILFFDLSWWLMCIVPFAYYALYCLEYIIRLFAYGRGHEAYKNISFEQEAFMNERNFNYLIDDERRAFAWVKYIARKTYKR